MVALTYPESIVQMDLALEADAGLEFNISARSHQSLVIASYSLKPNMHMYELADVQLNGREMPSYRSNNMRPQVILPGVKPRRLVNT
jgi:hypothetical protein